MKKAKAKIKKVIKGLKKASKTHAAQAKTLKGVIRGTRANTKQSKTSNQKKSRDVSYIGHIGWG